MTVLRAAVVGLGGIARIAHLPVLADRQDVAVVAVADPSAAALARHPSIPGFADVHELLAAVDVDAALVLAPEQHHVEVVTALLERRVPVLCEKPLAPSLPEARLLRDIAAERHTSLMVGFNRRFAPVYMRAKAAMSEHPAAVGVFEKTRPERGYRGSAENLVHMVDLARFFFGECAEVTARAVFDDPYWEDSLTALLEFEGGQLATVVGNRSTGVWTERVSLHGDGQSVTVVAPDQISVATGGEERTHRQTQAFSGFAAPTRTLGFAAQADHFFAAVRASAQITQNDASSAVRTQELMDRILASAGLPTTDGRTSMMVGHRPAVPPNTPEGVVR
ncbi:oxidoreductase domain protein [Beutenbergia cavernae DSM 12333]|uniref:Oxidoreductase domain protein n=1 Tax=Beutenbergia cavernae (strain ATCC BAA-8 / DSM 12333 / CCUG 43141 / JCM 11478 / NBRC 16432 / NCIMB 13614 / HKI 0122) TaxID=471853 RepID=C5C5U3_BEUC1|nr:Gfo/Idh/MocA family oxidoreductase [Beutenbergia cavernae]ACQ82301.1 oxidoreductase domain protein [Beutenbergia cavernae DSM 12333]